MYLCTTQAVTYEHLMIHMQPNIHITHEIASKVKITMMWPHYKTELSPEERVRARHSSLCKPATHLMFRRMRRV